MSVSGLDGGIVSTDDFVHLILTEGLKAASPQGFLAKIAAAITSLSPEPGRTAGDVLGRAKQTYTVLRSTATMEQVLPAACGTVGAEMNGTNFALRVNECVRPISDCTYVPWLVLIVPVFTLESPPQALKMFAAGVHYIGISEVLGMATGGAEAHIVGILPSMAMVRVLCAHPRRIPVLDVPVSVLFPARPVLTAGPDTTLSTAFAVLLARRYRGMPVVDGAGAIVTNISTADVRPMGTMSKEDIEAALLGTALQYLRAHKLDHTPVTVIGSDSIGTALRLMAANNVHRVYVVDGEQHPVSVITVTDMMMAIQYPDGIAALCEVDV